ncbi:MAG: CHASE2 domain-containing protein [Armatimonadota bacterium]|nr:MAG: CHASE2 domain-containing protein [Armatimonadota bacterium]
MATRSLARAGLLGLICGLAAFVVGAAGWLAGVDASAYDFGLRTRPPLPRVGRVAVVEINDETIKRLGRWPWPWSRHARFVRALQEHYKPDAIVFDLLFIEPDVEEEAAEFARAVKEAGNVYLAAFFSRVPGDGGREAGERIPWLVGEYLGEGEQHGEPFASLHPPTAELAEAAAGVGPVNVVPELDGSVRRLPLVLDHGGAPYVSLVGLVLDALVNPNRERPQVRPGEAVDLGGYVVPIDRCGETLVSYTNAWGDGFRQAFPHYRYDEVLSRSIRPRALEGKVVFVGFAATGMADVHPTPLTSGTFGLDINAHALNGLLQGRFLRVAGWPARLGLALALGLLASLVAGTWSPGRALAISMVLVAWCLGFAAFILWWRGIWLGAAAPSLAVLGAYTLTVAQRYRESERESLRMQSTVDALAQATRVIASVRLRAEVLEEVRAQITDAMGARQTNIYLAGEAGEELKLATASAGEGEAPLYDMEETTVGWVARHGMMHLVRDVAAGSTLSKELARSVGMAVGSVAYAPMAHRGEVVGVVEVVRGVSDARFEEGHLAVLEALANEAAVALRNVDLYEQLEGKVEIANRQLVRAYGELKQERDRVSAIVSNMADGVLLTDAEKRVVFVNPAAAAMFSAEAAEVEGKPVSAALPYAALLEQLDDEPLEPTTTVPRIRLEKPRRLVLSPRTVRLIDEEGKRTGAITVVSDITLLEELSEMKTEFVSLVSHELRTPLTSIMGFAQTLRSDTERLPPGEQDEFLGIIEQESNRLVVMINDLLDISRMEAGRALAMHYSEVDLRELAEHVIRFQRVTTSAHSFRFEFPEHVVSVEGDRDKVEQILTNLVSNAIKYSPRGGEIVVGASEERDEVKVLVRDQGVGMSQEEVGALFQPYQRVDRDAIKGIRGTGLGLYLVRGLTEAHAGRVWVESEPGQGSTFYFSLPKHRAEKEAGV